MNSRLRVCSHPIEGVGWGGGGMAGGRIAHLHPVLPPSRGKERTTTTSAESIAGFLPPHIGLPADDPVFLVLHFPPRAQRRFFERPGDQVTLRLFAPMRLQE